MRKTCFALIIAVGICSSAGAQWMVAPDGGIAPDGTLNYVFSAGFPFHPRGPLYPMPQPYWIPPSADSTSGLGGQGLADYTPITPEKRQ